MKIARSRQNCLRCETVKLRVIPKSTQEITFYECPSCSRHFAQKLGQGLCDRWLSPISLVLYGIIFERYPQDAYQRIAEQFLEQRAGDIPLSIEEITQELRKRSPVTAFEGDEDRRSSKMALDLISIELFLPRSRIY